MIAVGPDAVLRIHEASGRIRRSIIKGADPLSFDMEGDHFEILYFAFSAPGPYISQRVDVYAQAAVPLTPEKGLKLMRRLEPMLTGFDVTVFVRNDSWFIYEPTYPFLNPFVETGNPPTVEQYRGRMTLRCGHWGKLDTSCSIN